MLVIVEQELVFANRVIELISVELFVVTGDINLVKDELKNMVIILKRYSIDFFCIMLGSRELL